MWLKKTIGAVLLFSVVGCALPANALETTAKQAFLIDANTHFVLLNKDGDLKMHPSSMSKLMTVYILFSRLKEGRIKLTDEFPVSEKAWRTQGSKTFVRVGSSVSVDDLIHGIIVQSGNDACIVVAEALAGSEESFAQEMNRVAKEIGLTASNFANATGLPADNHLMSAHDLAILAERLQLDFPEYYHYFSIREWTYNNIKQQNRDRLLGSNIGVDGLKTGHTDAGGYGITLSAKQNDRRLILVINGLESDNARVEEGEKLLRWAFREFENKTLVKKGEKIAEAKVWLGKQETVPLVAGDDMQVTMQAGAAGKNPPNFTLKYNGAIPAPIKAGDHVADLYISSPDMGEQIVPLFAANNVDKVSAFGRIIPAFRYYILRQK
jgi:D-alanyl-D-alanine carboxypeptidase (penicillin-binding protein 5/6)